MKKLSTTGNTLKKIKTSKLRNLGKNLKSNKTFTAAKKASILDITNIQAVTLLTNNTINAASSASGNSFNNSATSIATQEIITGTNNPKNYEFDPENDIQIVAVKEKKRLSMTLFSNVPQLLTRGIYKIKVLISHKEILNITSERESIISTIEYNVNDYYNSANHDDIIEDQYLKTIQITDNKQTFKKSENHLESLKSLIKEKKSLGEFLRNKKHLNESFVIENSLGTTFSVVSENVVMKKLIEEKVPIEKDFFVKIIEFSKHPLTHVDVIESINSFYVKHKIINDNYEIINNEKNNYLNEFGTINKIRSNHILDIDNEKDEQVEIFTKNSLKNKFKNIPGLLNERNNYKKAINATGATIYRVTDKSMKLKDVFIGDVRKEFFENRPILTVVAYNKGILLILRDAPFDYLKMLIYRNVNGNKNNRKLVSVTATDDLRLSNNMISLLDKDVHTGMSYTYQVKFLTADGFEIFSTESNLQKFITPSKVFSMSTAFNEAKSEISVTAIAPESDAELAYTSISDELKSPRLNETENSTFKDNYKFLSFIKLSSINRVTGEVSVVGIKTAKEDSTAIFPIIHLNIEEFSFYCELFSGPLSTVLDNIASVAPFKKGDIDFTRNSDYSIGDNFLSKFSSYSSLSDGVLTYGRALANEPGESIEALKTGVIEKIKIPPTEVEVSSDNEEFSASIKIINRNIPKLIFYVKNTKIESFLIISTTKEGLSIRSEKASSAYKTILFHDVKAKTEFSDELVDYYFIPVYNNYKMGKITKIGTVLCSRDNFTYLEEK